MAEETETTDLRVAELQALLKEQTEKHSFQTKRADDLEKRLKIAAAAVRKYEAARGQLEVAAPTGDRVVLGGLDYMITGTFRADNTFVEVKRGHCEEGVTLIAIDKVH